MNFRDHIRSHIAPGERALEFGASYSPILRKSAGFNVSVVDHASADELRRKYADDPNVDVAMPSGGGFKDASYLSHPPIRAPANLSPCRTARLMELE